MKVPRNHVTLVHSYASLIVNVPRSSFFITTVLFIIVLKFYITSIVSKFMTFFFVTKSFMNLSYLGISFKASKNCKMIIRLLNLARNLLNFELSFFFLSTWGNKRENFTFILETNNFVTLSSTTYGISSFPLFSFTILNFTTLGFFGKVIFSFNFQDSSLPTHLFINSLFYMIFINIHTIVN